MLNRNASQQIVLHKRGDRDRSVTITTIESTICCVAVRYDLIRLIPIYKLIVLIVDKFWTVQKSSTFSHDWPHDLLRSVTICYDLLRSDTFTTIRPRLRPRCNDCGTWTWHIVTQSQPIATNRSGTYWLVTHRIQTWNFYKSSTISYDWLIVAYVTNRTTVGT